MYCEDTNNDGTIYIYIYITGKDIASAKRCAGVKKSGMCTNAHYKAEALKDCAKTCGAC